MANFIVNQTLDNGLGNTVGTLSYAILQANQLAGDDIITLNNNVRLTQEMLSISSNINIVGNGFSLSGDANGNGINDFGDVRGLSISSGIVNISSLTITNGRSQGQNGSDGGDGANGGYFGGYDGYGYGGYYPVSGGGGGGGGGGGAGMGGGLFIYDGTVTLNSVNFSNNAAIGGNGGNGGNGGGSGGSGGPGGSGGSGGSGSGGYSSNGGYGGYGGYGGGFFSGDGGKGGNGGGYGGRYGGNGGYGSFGTYGIFGGDGGGGGGAAGLGGGIFMRSGALTLINTNFTNNTAAGGSGGSGGYYGDGSDGSGLGGGLFILQGLTTVSSVGSPTFSGNSATDDDGTETNNDDFFGNISIVPANVTLAVSSVGVLENGTTNLVYTFTRTGPTTNALTVNYSITGTADATDYTGATPGTGKTITFAAGSATATLTIDPTADTTIEANETVALTLTTGTGYVIGTTAAVTGTITNDDFPTLSINDITVVEGKDASAFLTVSLSEPINQTVSVNYTITAINATAGSDYTTTSGTLTLAPNSTFVTISIPILNDDINESLEAFTVALSNPVNAKLSSNTNDSIGEVNISDTWYSGLTSTLPNGVENLTLIGVNAINGTGNSGNNILTGNSASNTLNGSTGVDTLIGGFGNDIYQVDSTTDIITENAGEGIDTIQSSVTYTIASLANIENLTLTGSSFINGAGNSANNILTGNSANNTLDGSTGVDTLIGGFGNDIYQVDSTTDIITENAGEGIDTIQSSVTYTIASLVNIENLTLTGSSVINGTGNAANNSLTGNTANNTLNGSDGNDTLNGGAGNDTLIGGNGNDYADYYSSTASVTVNLAMGTANDGLGGTDTLSQIENVQGSNTAGDNLTGDANNNTFYGYGGNDTLNGGDGNDLLIGGTGNDSLIGGNGTDIAYYYLVTGAVTANLATGIAIDGEGGTDTLSQIENIQGSNTAGDNLTGNTGVNVLYGYGGADILTGGGGNDLLSLGSDTFKDTVNYASGDGVDTVYNFVRGVGGDILKFTSIAAIDVQVSGTSTLFKVGDGISGNTGFGTGALLLTTSATTGFVAADVNVNLLGATFAFS
jgi:Ca2+-binding RTX toxin-like protein